MGYELDMEEAREENRYRNSLRNARMRCCDEEVENMIFIFGVI